MTSFLSGSHETTPSPLAEMCILTNAMMIIANIEGYLLPLFFGDESILIYLSNEKLSAILFLLT